MNKQRTFFDDDHARDQRAKQGRILGEAGKEIGMAEAADAKAEKLWDARNFAYQICLRRGYVTADDVQDFDLGPAAGSLFRGDKRFKWDGRRVTSSQPNNHARELKVWVLR